MGGAIFQNSGTLIISNVVLSGNTALGGSSTAGNLRAPFSYAASIGVPIPRFP